jgi:hypothetical protein
MESHHCWLPAILNIKVGNRDITREVMGWIELAHDRTQWSAFVKTAKDIRISALSQNFINI